MKKLKAATPKTPKTPTSASSPPSKGRANFASLFAKADDSDAVKALKAQIDAKAKEVIDLSEKNFKLFKRLQKAKDASKDAKADLEDIRGLLIDKVAGASTDHAAYANIGTGQLVHLATSAKDAIGTSSHGTAASIVSEAKRLKGKGSIPQARSPKPTGPLEAEITVLKSHTRKLEAKIASLREKGEKYDGAKSSLESVNERNHTLIRRLASEKDRRMDVEKQLKESGERVSALSGT